MSFGASDLFLAIIVAYDATTLSTRTLYYGSKPFVTAHGDTPADTFFDGRLRQPATLSRSIFRPGSTTFGRSTISYGDLVLENGDGALDALGDYYFDGRSVTILRGTVGAAYSSFVTVFKGTMLFAVVDSTSVTIKLTDLQQSLDLPLQATKFAGNNALPAGLEGVSDLLGKPKPITLGKVFNVSPPCVNTSKLIYQLNDGAIASLDAVRDKGATLGDHLFIANGFGSVGSSFNSTSPDGASWTRSTLPFSATFISYACGGGTIVACGFGGLVATSLDGQAWTSRTLTGWGAPDVLMVVYANSLFVAVGQAGKIATSPDGITWTMRADALGTLPNPFGGSQIQNAAYGAGLWVIVGQSGKLYTTTDFVTFTSRTSQFGANAIYGVAWSGSLFVICGYTSTSTSSDGITWTARTASASTAWQVAYGNSMWIQATYDGLWGSTDGITWAKKHSSLSDAVLCVTFAAGAFYSGHNDGVIGYSIDGAAWTPIASALATIGQVQGICYCSGLSPQTYANSTDLLDDTKAPQPGMWKVYLAGGYVRLGATPAGTITCDVTQGANAAARTAAQLAVAVLGRDGLSAGAWSASDITTLDAQNAAVCGLYIDSETTFGAVLDALMSGIGGWWGVDATGVYRFKQFTAELGHWTTVGDGSWGTSGTPTRSAAASTVNGLPLDRIGDNDITVVEGIYRVMPFVTNGQKVISFLVKRVSAYASHRFTGWDGVAFLYNFMVNFVATTPVVTMTTGTLLSVVAVDTGWRITILTSTVTASRSNQFWLEPAYAAAADTAQIDIGDIRFWDSAPKLTIGLSDLLRPLARVAPNDVTDGVPVFLSKLGYGRNYTVQDGTALAGIVTTANRALYAQEYQQVTATDASVQTGHPLAPITDEQSCIQGSADAQIEATRRQALRGTRRDRYELLLQLNDDTQLVDLGDTLFLAVPRYGLTGGQMFDVIGLTPDNAQRQLVVDLWGGGVE